MKTYTLHNDQLEVTIDSLGAEVKSIKDRNTGNNYLWNGNPEFWGRTSPVLFPIVGACKNKEYTYEGKTYSITNHGFARDMEYSLVKQKEEELWFLFKSNESTYERYPFTFQLYNWYRLQGRKLTCGWKVVNTSDKTMHFSLGAHPAFCCPLHKEDTREQYFIRFDGSDRKEYRRINERGLAKENTSMLTIKEGILPFDTQLFAEDVLIFEGDQAHEVALLTPDKKPYVTVKFTAPLFGLWTPSHKTAPFICIEPWYGRCDKDSFTGTLEEREWGNHLAPQEIFEASYEIILA